MLCAPGPLVSLAACDVAAVPLLSEEPSAVDFASNLAPGVSAVSKSSTALSATRDDMSSLASRAFAMDGRLVFRPDAVRSIGSVDILVCAEAIALLGQRWPAIRVAGCELPFIRQRASLRVKTFSAPDRVADGVADTTAKPDGNTGWHTERSVLTATLWLGSARQRPQFG